MIHDGRAIENDTAMACDLAIVGAGGAGVAIAHALLGTRLKVCLLESGGLEFEPEVQALYKGAIVGQPYFALDATRMRYFGGTMNAWAGRCRPMDELDFAPRPWVPLAGWPISRADLAPYLVRAQELCGLGPFEYDAEPWLGPGQEVLPFAPGEIVSRVWQFSPIFFADAYRGELEAAENLDLILHANVVEIVTNEAGSEVQALAAATLEGRRWQVRPKAVVLACGGLETPRLLLASRQTINAGLGNQNDMVGRCFMEHPHVNAARALVLAPELVQFYSSDFGAGGEPPVAVVGCLSLSPKRQKESKLLNFDALFTTDNVGAGGFAALRRVWNAAERGTMPEDLTGDLGEAVLDIDDTVAGLLGRFGWREYRPETAAFRMWTSAEQAPNRDSRVLLSDEVDALGLPRIRLDWRLAEIDKRSFQAAHEVIANEFGRTGLGRLQIADWVTAGPDVWGDDLEGGHHHMGTTRMSDDPKQGVVDRDCRVHGTSNLYIAGSSVFATSGAANPTLTLLALALRLADTLAARLEA